MSVQKLNKEFGKASGIAMELARFICHNNWKSAWLNLKPDMNSWLIIDHVYWKNVNDSTPVIAITDDDSVEKIETSSWLINEFYNLTMEDKSILISETAFLNDKIMDAAQKLICKALGNLDTYQSVLNSQRKDLPFYPSDNEHLQLMHDGSNHWILTFCSSGQVQVCDSLRDCINRETQRFMKALYSLFLDIRGKMRVTFLPVQRQDDGSNCGAFAIAFAAEILDGKSPMSVHFDVGAMRLHLIKCLETKELSPFPKSRMSTNMTYTIPVLKTRSY